MGRKRLSDRDDARDNRASESRTVESRKADQRELLGDEMESPLYIPREEWPDGKTYRWVRIEAGNAADNKNWSQMTRVGWTPVDRTRHLDRFPLINMPGQGDITDGKILFGGLCLCERDTRLVERDRSRQQQETVAQNESINTYVEAGTGNFPRFNQSSSVQYDRAPAFKE